MAQFDELAEIYEEFSRRPFRRELEFPSVLGLLGGLGGLRILDVGCGCGIYSRVLARSGAGRVVGLDESGGMLDHARACEARQRLGISYMDGALPPEMAGDFDLVLGVYVLPYAATYKELVGLCRIAAKALRPGGRFLTLPIHPEVHRAPGHYERYGFRLYVDQPLADGAPVDLQFCFGGHDVHVTAHYWGAAVLEEALREAGFGSLRWRSHRLSPAAAAGPSEFWEPYLSAPHAAILDAFKEHEST